MVEPSVWPRMPSARSEIRKDGVAGGGGGSKRRGRGGKEVLGGRRATGNRHEDGRAARRIKIGERGHFNLLACEWRQDRGGRGAHDVRGKRRAHSLYFRDIS